MVPSLSRAGWMVPAPTWLAGFMAFLAWCLGGGLPAEARQELSRETFAEVFGDAGLELEHGDPRRARERFEAALTRSPRNPSVAYALACCAARSGERRAALRWLERAVDWGWVDAELCLWDEDLAGLREDSRFLLLTSRMRHELERRLEAGTPAIAIWHGSPAWADEVVLSPDGERALTRDGVLWDVGARTVVALLFTNPARAAIYSCFGTVGVAASAERGRSVRFHDPRDGSLLTMLGGRAYPAYPIEFDAREERLAMASSGGRTRIWELATEEQVASFETSGDAPSALSPRGDRLLTLGTARAVLWRVDEPLELWSEESERRESWEGAFDETGELCLVLTRNAGVVTVLDAAHGAVVARLETPGVRLTAADFRARERAIVTGDEHGRVESWDAARGVELSGFQAHEGAVLWLVLSRDGELLVTAGADGYIRAWDLVGGEALWEVQQESRSARASFDARAEQVVLPAEDGAFELRGPVDGEVLARFQYPVLRAVDAAFERDARRALILTADGSLCRIDVASGATRRIAGGLGPDAARVAVSPSGDRVATSSMIGDVHLLDVNGGRELARVAVYEGSKGTPELGFSSSGRFLMTYGRGSRAALLDAETGELVRWIEQRDFALEDLVWSRHTERFALVDASQRVLVHDAESGEALGRPLDHRARVRCMVFTPDGEMLLTGSDDGVARLFDVRTGSVVRTLRSEDLRARGRVGSADISPDGAMVVTAVGEGGVLVAWDLESGRQRWVRELGAATPNVLEVRFAPDGQRIHVGGEFDRGGYILSSANGAVLAELGASVGRVRASDDGRYLLALGGGSCRVFDAASGHQLYRRIELEGGEHLLLTNSGHCSGSPEAMSRVQLLLDGESASLDALAAELFDPKRLRAARAGVALAPPRAMRPPRLALAGPLLGTIERDARGRVRLEGLAEDPSGVLAVEVRREGELLARTLPEPLAGTTAASFEFVLEFEPPPGPGALELRVLGGSGLESRAARLRLR